ncbi:zincin [Aspergillus sclerotioniger CBS 115572]|uniref:Zincin n=1 Tax=Aspergillus sclerotioniger CBS 115572 TaxID=1450535 RepID=A0A317VYL9_9EURO|nr:zincin [Aspergillus sclerotioniger CBS 115572]PWY78057.1 zincin [Aspergillus sclerotioniger CBS 115572]
MSTPQSLPRVLKVHEIIPTMQRIVSQQNAIKDEIICTVSPLTASFDTVLRPWADVENLVQGELGMIYMLQYGSPDMATQDAFTQARQLLLAAELQWASNEDFHRLVQAVHDKHEELDTESALFLKEELLVYRRAGWGVLSAAQREEYLQEKREISKLESAFNRNLAQEDGGVWFVKSELDGIPADDLAKWKMMTNTQTPSQEIYVFVPFANGGMMTVGTLANNPNTRKKMYLENNRKLAVNGPIFEEIIKRRTSQAHLLGYPSHAAVVLERRIAKTPQWVETFLSQIQDDLVARGKTEVEVLQRHRLQDLQSQDQEVEGRFPAWDQMYYQRLVEKGFQIDHVQIAEFFPVERTAAAMLEIFASVLGLRFDAITAQSDQLWHESVQVFAVWDDRSSEFIRYLHFDLLWRENKYRGNQNVTIEAGYTKSDGSRSYPSTILMCAFPTPTPDSCALLKHHQVITLFHELGHGIHNLLSKTKYVRFHGVNLPRDLSEMPSTNLENWCWIPDVLKSISCHYTTMNSNYLAKWRSQNPGLPDPPQKIPDELVDNLVKYRYWGRGLYHLEQLTTSLFDLKIHSFRNPQDLSSLNMHKLWYDLRHQLEGMDFSECRDGFDYCAFTHLCAAYDAGYYSYLCCAAFAEDVFQTKFAHDPFNRDAWDEYRREFLQIGGGNGDMLGLMTQYLGRAPNSRALVDRLMGATAVV